MDYEPHLSANPPVAPALDLRHKEIPVDNKKALLAWLESQLTEEKTDAVIQYIGDLAKISLPDVPVDVAEKILDLVLPGALVAALEKVLD